MSEHHTVERYGGPADEAPRIFSLRLYGVTIVLFTPLTAELPFSWRNVIKSCLLFGSIR